MKKATLNVSALILAGLFSNITVAACSGYGMYKTCSDGQGNHYKVQRYGGPVGVTKMQGHNNRTGSQWNQTTTDYGSLGIIQHRGTTNGNNWNLNSNTIGGTTHYSGTDANGRAIRCMQNQLLNINTCK